MRSVFIIIFFIVLTLNGMCQNRRDFYYTETYNDVDFNSSAFDSAAFGLMDPCNCMKIINFEIDSSYSLIHHGGYTILQYEIHIYGMKDPFTVGFSKEIILIKLLNDVIVESYWIPCDWEEPPITTQILHSTTQIPYRQKIRVKKLKFKNIESVTCPTLDRTKRRIKRMRFLNAGYKDHITVFPISDPYQTK